MSKHYRNHRFAEASPVSHEKDVAVCEVEGAKERIKEWQKHILRGVQQTKARTKAFEELGPTNALWIPGYAQKFNPSKVIYAFYYSMIHFQLSGKFFFLLLNRLWRE